MTCAALVPSRRAASSRIRSASGGGGPAGRLLRLDDGAQRAGSHDDEAGGQRETHEHRDDPHWPSPLDRRLSHSSGSDIAGSERSRMRVLHGGPKHRPVEAPAGASVREVRVRPTGFPDLASDGARHRLSVGPARGRKGAARTGGVSMFNSGIIDVALGLIFIYLLLSLVCSAINEMIEARLKMRAKDLERGLRELLNDREGKGLVKDLYSHPLVLGLYPGHVRRCPQHDGTASQDRHESAVLHPPPELLPRADGRHHARRRFHGQPFWSGRVHGEGAGRGRARSRPVDGEAARVRRPDPERARARRAAGAGRFGRKRRQQGAREYRALVRQQHGPCVRLVQAPSPVDHPGARPRGSRHHECRHDHDCDQPLQRRGGARFAGRDGPGVRQDRWPSRRCGAEPSLAHRGL